MELTPLEARVLRAVMLLAQATRKTIADHVDLGRVVVSGALSELLRKGYIQRASAPSGKGGRPAHVYSANGELGRVVGVSLDPDTIRTVTLDSARKRISARTVPLGLSESPGHHIDEVVDRLVRAVEETSADVTTPLLEVGVTLPGVTNADQGTWVQGFQVTGIHHVNIRDLLQRRLGVPALVEDPARAAAVRELREGHGRGGGSFVLLYLDYGVGSGVVLHGGLYRGRDGLSGEVGHLVVDPGGYRCSCGDVGCLETIASTSGILRCIRDRLDEGVVSALQNPTSGDPKGITTDDVLRAADAGDRLAQSTLHEIGERIGTACATVIKLINPERLIVSGANAMFARYFEPRIRMTLEKHVIPEMLAGLELVFSEHTPHDEAHGVALMAMEHYWSLFPASWGAKEPSPAKEATPSLPSARSAPL